MQAGDSGGDEQRVSARRNGRAISARLLGEEPMLLLNGHAPPALDWDPAMPPHLAE